MKIIAFGASTSKKSINQELATYVAKNIKEHDVKILNLNDYDMPIYSIDKQNEGFPESSQEFYKLIKEADGIIISLAEHNLNFTTAFKNILDWLSRIEMAFLKDKKLFVLSTSPGQYGGGNVLEVGLKYFKVAKAEIIESYALPSFNANFANEQITNSEIKSIVNVKTKNFIKVLESTTV